MNDIIKEMEQHTNGRGRSGPIALVISIILLICSPVFFWMLLDAAASDRERSKSVYENRQIQCDSNAMMRKHMGIEGTLPICDEPPPVPHKRGDNDVESTRSSNTR